MINVLSHLSRHQRRDFELADSTLADPNETTALDAGEWGYLDSSGKLARDTGATAGAKTNAYMVLTPKGSTDMQALGKAAVLFGRDAEVETDMFRSEADGGHTWAVGDRVGIVAFSIDGTTRMVFDHEDNLTADQDYVYGTVTLAPDNNSDKLRVQLCSPYVIPA